MRNTSAKKVSVVGVSGFIGTSLCQRFVDRQIPFEIIDLKVSAKFPDKTRIADIRNKDQLRNAITGDVVVNLAAIHTDDVSDPNSYVSTNVDGTGNIVEICDEKRIDKIVFTSTVAVYGFAPPGTGESGAINPFNDYGSTKWQAEEILDTWHKAAPEQKFLLIIRPTVVFGEGNRGNVYNLLNQIASGRFVMIGNGRNRKSMAYVGNVAAFIDACVQTERKRCTFNYVDSPDMNALVSLVLYRLTGKTGVGPRLPRWLGIAIGHLFDMVARLALRKFPISAIRVTKFTAESSYTSAKHDLDGFEPPFTINEGLERTLQSEFVAPDPAREIFHTE